MNELGTNVIRHTKQRISPRYKISKLDRAAAGRYKGLRVSKIVTDHKRRLIHGPQSLIDHCFFWSAVIINFPQHPDWHVAIKNR